MMSSANSSLWYDEAGEQLAAATESLRQAVDSIDQNRRELMALFPRPPTPTHPTPQPGLVRALTQMGQSFQRSLATAIKQSQLAVLGQEDETFEQLMHLEQEWVDMHRSQLAKLVVLLEHAGVLAPGSVAWPENNAVDEKHYQDGNSAEEDEVAEEDGVDEEDGVAEDQNGTEDDEVAEDEEGWVGPRLVKRVPWVRMMASDK